MAASFPAKSRKTTDDAFGNKRVSVKTHTSLLLYKVSVVHSEPVETGDPCKGNENDMRITAENKKGIVTEDSACLTDTTALRAPLQIAHPIAQSSNWHADMAKITNNDITLKSIAMTNLPLLDLN